MTVQKNNMVEDTCAFNRHGGPAQFILTARNGDNWSVCTRHASDMMIYLVESTQAAYPSGPSSTPDVPWSPFTIEIIPSNFHRRGPSVVDRMEDRGRSPLGGRYELSCQGEADRIANGLVDGSITIDDSDVYAVERLRATRYTIAGGGPGEDVTFVESDNGLEYALVDVQTATGRAFTVLADPTVDALFEKFRGTEG